MTEESRDLRLQRVFANARDDLPGGEFGARVMARTDKMKRRATLGRIIIIAVVTLLGLPLIGIPLQGVALAFTELLMTTLVELDSRLAAQVLAPLNTVGSLLAVLLLVLRDVHERVLS